MKVTFGRLSRILIALKSINSNDKNGNAINDRLSWAIQRFQEKNESNLKRLDSEETDINREYASVDETTKIFVAGGNGALQFTRENLKKCTEALEKFKTEKTCDIEVYVCKNDLTRSSLLPIWIQKELDGIVVVMNDQLKKFQLEEEAEAQSNNSTATIPDLKAVENPVKEAAVEPNS